MRTPFGIGLVAAALVALPAPAAEATPVPAAPTNVTVAWEASGVRITWQETGDYPDQVCQEGNASSCVNTLVGQADSVLIPANVFSPSTSTRVSVQITGANPSGPGYSAVFDTQRLTAPTVTTIEPWVDGRLRLAWTASALPTDVTPGDPLDLPPPAQYRLLSFSGDIGIPFGPVVTTTSTVITAPHGGLFAVVAVNEWTWTEPPYPAPSTYLNIWATDVHATIPTTASYGRDTVVTGTVLSDAYYCFGSPPGCSPSPDGPGTPVSTPSAGRQVVLQGRDAGTWYTVTSGLSDANGKFRFAVRSPGTRDYRVMVLGVHKPPSSVAKAAAVSPPVHTITTNRVVSARFDDPYVSPGDKVTARLTMAVRSNVRTTLQRWNGSAWVDVKWVYLTDGTGSYTFTAGAGVVGWRFVIPATTSPAGLPVAGTSSGPFYYKAV